MMRLRQALVGSLAILLLVFVVLASIRAYHVVRRRSISEQSGRAPAHAGMGRRVSLQTLQSLRIVAKTSSSVRLSWSAQELAPHGAARLALFRGGVEVTPLPPGTESFTDRSLQWGTTYSYFLRIWSVSGQATDSDVVWVTTDAPRTGLNIVLIVTDDQRWDTLRYMPWTRRLLGAKGVTFTHAFSGTPTCCPSRASILTGLYSHNHGVLSNEIGATAFSDRATLATWLKARGYRTALISKYLNRYTDLTPWPYVPPGWDLWNAFKNVGYYDYALMEGRSEVAYGTDPGEYSTDVLVRKAIDFVQARADAPFFLYFAPYAPHRPYTPAPPDRALPVPAYARPPSFDETDVSRKPAWVQALPPLGWTTARVEEIRRDQIRSLRSLDRALKALLEALAGAGRLSDTVIIFTSDNGYAWGEHRWRGKACPYESCAHIPLVIRAPGIRPRVESGLVQLEDLAPSIMAWSGGLHGRVDGASLAHLLVDPATPWRTALLIEELHGDPGTKARWFSAVRTARYLYAEYLNGDSELYDLAVDPYELTNVVQAPAYAAARAGLRAILDRLRKQ